MKIGKIWQRYFLKQLWAVFFLFILCFYGLYILIDYSSHASVYRSVHFTFLDLLRYYFYLFIQRLDILIPFAFLIATIRTLCALNVRNELIALLASGIKLSTLMRPFIGWALFLIALLYLNTQFLIPASWDALQRMESRQFEIQMKEEGGQIVQNVELKDRTLLIFHHYDPIRKRFDDVYWIRSFRNIYRIRTLFIDQTIAHGEYVEHFVRNSTGQLLLQETQDRLDFPDFQFDQNALTESLMLPQQQSFSALWKKLPQKTEGMSDKEARNLTAFYYKLAIPWLCLLVFIAPAPFCLQFTRQLPVFFIYLVGMLGTVAYYLMMSTAVVLGENQVVPPVWAIWLPFGLFFIFFSWRYLKNIG